MTHEEKQKIYREEVKYIIDKYKKGDILNNLERIIVITYFNKNNRDKIFTLLP